MGKGRFSQGKVAGGDRRVQGYRRGESLRALGAEGASVVVNYANDKKGAEKTAAAIV